jgi:CheY-like chemotaxis protein
MRQLCVLLVSGDLGFLTPATETARQDPHVARVVAAATGQDALRASAATKPDLVLMDMTIPDMRVLELTKRLKARSDPCRVILMATLEPGLHQAAAATLGADGVVEKSKFSTAFSSLAVP